MAFWIALGVVPVGIAIALRGYFRMLGGEDLSQYEKDIPPTFTPEAGSPGLSKVNAYLVENFIKPAQAANAKRGWEDKRERFEQAGLARTDLKAEYKDDVVMIDGVAVPGAWTLVKGHDPSKRILYLHGGAMTVGSAVSHRPLTVNLAKRTGAAVFAPNYRLMPENPRMAPLEDCQAAYKWIIETGPDGPAPLSAFAIAGDSAGGNLTLAVLNWARDEGLRQVDAAYALSPNADSTVQGSSWQENLEKDLMLQPLVRPLLKIPRPLLLLGMKKQYGMAPSDPRVSPIMDDLSGLPPTLVQASYDEMLYSDAQLYVAKAQAAGSPASLQSWTNMPHVFQIFDDVLPEAHHALDEAAAFLKAHGF